MENNELLATVTEKAKVWLGEGYDEETRTEVKRMLDADDKTELIESFYKDLEFGPDHRRPGRGGEHRRGPSGGGHSIPEHGYFKRII